MVSVRFATGLKYVQSRHLCKVCFYIVVEGAAFLVSKYGLGVIAGSQAILLFQTAGYKRVLGVTAKAAFTCFMGRMIHILVLEMRKSPAMAPTEVEREDADREEEVEEERGHTSSIWDWQPPGGDSFSSGAWFVIKELVMTMNKFRQSYPEIETLLSMPEMKPPELASRLYYYYQEHELNTDREDESLVDCPQADETDINKLEKYREFSCFAYDKTSDETLNEVLNNKGYSLLCAKYKPELMPTGSPAYYLAIRNSEGEYKEVLLVVRGTYSPEDVFTDLFASGVSFGSSGSAHMGMAKAANYLKKKFGALFTQWGKDGHQVTVVGHSLGAGVASLLSLSLQDDGMDNSNLQCFAYEPPACVDISLSRKCESTVLSVVNRDDIVPRMAAIPFINLLKNVSMFDWRTKVDSHGEMPIVLRMITTLLQFSDTGEQTSAHQKEPIYSEGKTSTDDYKPVVPGRIIYIQPASETMSTTTESSEKGSHTSSYVQVGSITRVVIHPEHPVLMTMRLSSNILNDHFIDSEEFIGLLQSI